MESPGSRVWYLRKHEDGRIFGPLSFEQLQKWASAAQVAPQDLISFDQEQWIKAPMLPELQLDYLVEITSEQFYGPTTIGALEEFLRQGEIDEATYIINTCDEKRLQLGDLPALTRKEAPSPTPEEPSDESAPGPASMAAGLPQRIRRLEEALREERRALGEIEARYRELAARHETLLQQIAASSPPMRDV